MTLSGWIVLFISVGGTTVFFLWAVTKVLRTPGETGRVHGFEFETPDEQQQRLRDNPQESSNLPPASNSGF